MILSIEIQVHIETHSNKRFQITEVMALYPIPSRWNPFNFDPKLVEETPHQEIMDEDGELTYHVLTWSPMMVRLCEETIPRLIKENYKQGMTMYKCKEKICEQNKAFENNKEFQYLFPEIFSQLLDDELMKNEAMVRLISLFLKKHYKTGMTMDDCRKKFCSKFKGDENYKRGQYLFPEIFSQLLDNALMEEKKLE